MKRLCFLLLFFAVKGFAQDAINMKELVGDKRVVYIGEVHSDTSSKNFLAAKLPELKKLGFTHVVLEMFNNSSQKLLEKYAAGKADDKEIFDYLMKNWGWFPQNYLPILKAAKELQLTVVALDKRSEGIVQEARDDVYMAEMIAKTIKNKSHRAVVLIGQDHVNAAEAAREFVQYQPGILLERHKIESVSLAVVPLHEIFWDYRTQERRLSPRSCHLVPGCMRIRMYQLYDEPVRASLRSRGVSTDETSVSSTRAESGYDGLLVLDGYNTDAPIAKDE